MSNDFHLRCEHGYGPDIECGLTYNLTPMHYQACGYNWREFEKMPIKEVREILRKALAALILNPKHFKGFNSSNGWGTYEDLKNTYEKLINKMDELEEEGRLEDLHFVVT